MGQRVRIAAGRGRAFVLLPSKLQEVLASVGCVQPSLHHLRSMPCFSASQCFPCYAQVPQKPLPVQDRDKSKKVK